MLKRFMNDEVSRNNLKYFLLGALTGQLFIFLYILFCI